ncbi:hypothetical protein HSB1_44560 [Halogranum salarium B-1]|uniref:Membrane-bound metal-dependent hydrolase n=2 Tax=Halogranum rubrum TaxID=553466 RepID=J2Z8W3_9EURY|nr:hypothetical protein HSB1_44560 [Halogranum salarium B-1]
MQRLYYDRRRTTGSVVMLPWAHAGIGYLLWSVLTRYRERRPPSDLEAWVLLFGTQFPDLVDKPLAWTFGILPSGRSLGHSLFTLSGLFVVGYVVSKRWGRTNLVVAFGVGSFSHTFADTYRILLEERYASLGYLLWPILRTPGEDMQRSIIDHFRGASFGVSFSIQLLLALVVALVWFRDGAPGLPTHFLLSNEATDTE